MAAAWTGVMEGKASLSSVARVEVDRLGVTEDHRLEDILELLLLLPLFLLLKFCITFGGLQVQGGFDL